jgi:hypothetical protein
MIRFTFWLKRLLHALNFVAAIRRERRAERAEMLEAVREVCSVIRSQNALAEAQTKLFAQWFESLSIDPAPGRSINYTPQDELAKFAADEGVEVGKLTTYY